MVLLEFSSCRFGPMVSKWSFFMLIWSCRQILLLSPLTGKFGGKIVILEGKLICRNGPKIAKGGKITCEQYLEGKMQLCSYICKNKHQNGKKFHLYTNIMASSSSCTSKSQANELCRHGFPAVRRTSWSDDNPGRRFLNCKFSQTFQDCGYFSWFDEPMCARSTQIIPGLLRNKNKVESELKSAEEDNKALLICIQKLEDEVKHLKAKLKKKNKGKEMLMNVHLYYIVLLTLSSLPVFVKWAVNKMF